MFSNELANGHAHILISWLLNDDAISASFMIDIAVVLYCYLLTFCYFTCLLKYFCLCYFLLILFGHAVWLISHFIIFSKLIIKQTAYKLLYYITIIYYMLYVRY